MDPLEPARNGITRRNFMKTSALTVGALTLLSQGIALASGESGSGSGSCRKIVKLKRVWNVSSDDELASGTGSDPQEQIAYAYAVQAMMNKLESQGHLTQTLIDSQNQYVPCSWVLKSFDSENDGESGTSSIDIEDQLNIPPSEPGGNYQCAVVGSVSATTTKVTMNWHWGPA